MKKLNILVLVIFTLIYIQSNGQYIIDSSFSQDGYFISTHNQISHAYKIHELSNGNILVIGTKNAEIHIWQYDAMGNPVLSFGTNGEATNAAMNAELGNIHTLYDYAIYDNGKIMVMAELQKWHPTHFDSTSMSIALLSFNANGSINTSFNSTGYLLDKPNPIFEYAPHSLLIDAKENETFFYVGSESFERGHTTCPIGKGNWCISKYNQVGGVDVTFNSIGYLQPGAQALSATPLQSPHARIKDMKLMSNGSVRVVGALHNFDQAYFDVAIKPNGQFDSTFGNNGLAQHAVTFTVGHGGDLTDARILDDNTVVFYSSYPYYSPQDSCVVSMVKNDAQGNPMNNFGLGGVANFRFESYQSPKILYKSDNSMIISYYRKYANTQKIGFLKLLPNGSVDTSFGTNGILSSEPITPDLEINQSSVSAGTLTATETGFYLTASKKPASYPNYGIFKYNILTTAPLSTKNVGLEKDVIIYPNPLRTGESIIVQNATPKSAFSLVNMQGVKMGIKVIQKANDVSVTPYQNLATGVYFLKIHSENCLTTKTILIQ